MSSDSRDTTPGTLVVGVPHWATTVRVFDNSYRLMAAPGTPVDAGGNFQIKLELPPGVYRVEAALGGTNDSEWVSVRGGKRSTIPAERWSTLQLASAAPLTATTDAASKGPDVHAKKAAEWSRVLTWTSAQVGPSRLFVYVQTPDPKEYPKFSQGLSLLDENSGRLTSLDGAAVRATVAEGWMAFTTDLPAGFYILAREGPGNNVYNLPLYLCDYWETHIFMAGGKGPSFRSATINMAPYGHGFRYDDDTAAAAEAVLSGLRRERGTPGVLASSHLNVLLRREQKNPWLAVLAAYALMAVEDHFGRPQHDEATAHLVDPTLRADILQFLRHTIGSHPDVRALCLDPNVPSPSPFEVPPLMRIGLQRVRQHSTKFADTIPVGSLTDRILTSQLTTSPWSVWMQPGVSATPADSSFVKRTRRSRSLSEPTLRATLGPSAPVASPAAGAGGEDLRRVLHDLPLIKAAQNLMDASEDATPDKIELRPQEEATKLLDEIDPSAFSRASGIPLGRATRVLDSLRITPKAAARRGDPTERAILEYAVRKGATIRRSEQGPNAPPVFATPGPMKARGPTLEEAAVALRDAAEQLLTQPDDPAQDPSIDAQSKALAERLLRLAERSLQHADLVAITGDKGELLYGNGAFTLLMSFVDKKDPLRASRKWSRWLSQLPLGRSSQQSPERKSSDRRWTIRRVPVEDQETGKTTAFVNVFDDERTSRLPSDVFDAVVSAASDVTLHASFVQYASLRRRRASLERLEQLVNQLEQQLS